MGLREAGRFGAILAGAAAVCLVLACKLHAITVNFMSHRHATKMTHFPLGSADEMGLGCGDILHAVLIGYHDDTLH